MLRLCSIVDLWLYLDAYVTIKNSLKTGVICPLQESILSDVGCRSMLPVFAKLGCISATCVSNRRCTVDGMVVHQIPSLFVVHMHMPLTTAVIYVLCHGSRHSEA